MTACRQTDALERRLARGEPLSGAQAQHARGCPVCGATVSAAARLDESLPTAARRMVIEPLPPAADLLGAGERRGASRLVSVLGALGAAATAGAVIVVAIVSGQFINLAGGGDSGDGLAPGSSSVAGQVGAVPEAMAAWVAGADDSILDHMDRGRLLGADLTLVRLERCGDTALAFFADPQPSDYPLLTGAGDYRDPDSGSSSGGAAISVDDPESAYLRTQVEPCDVVVDTEVTRDDALAAYLSFLGGNDRVRDPQVLATKLVTADIGLAYLTEIQTDGGQPHQQVLVMRYESGGWNITGAQGGDLPVVGSSVGVTPLGVAKGMPDDRMAAVGRTDDERAVAVEIDFQGFPHRYPISDGAFVIQLPPNAGFGLPYRLLDAAGGVLSEGVTQP